MGNTSIIPEIKEIDPKTHKERIVPRINQEWINTLDSLLGISGDLFGIVVNYSLFLSENVHRYTCPLNRVLVSDRGPESQGWLSGSDFEILDINKLYFGDIVIIDPRFTEISCTIISKYLYQNFYTAITGQEECVVSYHEKSRKLKFSDHKSLPFQFFYLFDHKKISANLDLQPSVEYKINPGETVLERNGARFYDLIDKYSLFKVDRKEPIRIIIQCPFTFRINFIYKVREWDEYPYSYSVTETDPLLKELGLMGEKMSYSDRLMDSSDHSHINILFESFYETGCTGVTGPTGPAGVPTEVYGFAAVSSPTGAHGPTGPTG